MADVVPALQAASSPSNKISKKRQTEADNLDVLITSLKEISAKWSRFSKNLKGVRNVGSFPYFSDLCNLQNRYTNIYTVC